MNKTQLIFSIFISRICLFNLIFYFLPFVIYGQKVKASSYGFNKEDNRIVLYEALNNNDTIVIDKQDHDWIISPFTMWDLKDKTIIFEENVIVKAKSGAFLDTSDSLFKFINCENLTILGNNSLLKMNKQEYVNGEWRMGVSFVKCKDVILRDLTISSTGGDGIYIGGLEEGSYSENIIIDNVVSTNNKRQGMSIVSAKDVWVKNSIFTKTNGTLPEAGLDIEPDSEKDIISNINFENCVFSNNNHAGIALALINLTDNSHPVSISFKDCYLSMNHDISNSYPAAEIIVTAHPKFPVKGKVLFSDIFINGSDWRFLYTSKPSSGFHVAFKDVGIVDICQQDELQSAIYLQVPDSYNRSGPIGGFSFENMLLNYNSKSSIFTVKGSRLRTLRGVEDITGDITVINPNLIDYMEYRNYNSSNNRNFTINFTLLNPVNSN